MTTMTQSNTYLTGIRDCGLEWNAHKKLVIKCPGGCIRMDQDFEVCLRYEVDLIWVHERKSLLDGVWGKKKRVHLPKALRENTWAADVARCCCCSTSPCRCTCQWLQAGPSSVLYISKIQALLLKKKEKKHIESNQHRSTIVWNVTTNVLSSLAIYLSFRSTGSLDWETLLWLLHWPGTPFLGNFVATANYRVPIAVWSGKAKHGTCEPMSFACSFIS